MSSGVDNFSTGNVIPEAKHDRYKEPVLFDKRKLNVASEPDAFAQAMANPAEIGSMPFPGNPFRFRSAGESATAQVTKHSPEDGSSHSALYAIEAILQPDGHTVEIVRFLSDHRILDLTALIERTPLAHIPAIGGFDLDGRDNTLKLIACRCHQLGRNGSFYQRRQDSIHGEG